MKNVLKQNIEEKKLTKRNERARIKLTTNHGILLTTLLKLVSKFRNLYVINE